MAKSKVATIEEITKKWLEITPTRVSYYEAGINTPDEDWATNTIAAMGAYKGAVQAADIGRRFAGGVKKVGTEKWKRKALELGVDRYGPGVLAAGDDYKAGFAPFIEVIEGTDLPDRKPRGDPANIERVKKLADALFKKRLALIGAT